MVKEESKKISKGIDEIKEHIHAYAMEPSAHKPEERAYKVRKLVTRAKEKERHLTLKLHKAESKESIAEKRKRDIDSFTHTD